MFALTALWSVRNFATLSRSIDNIMRDNYRSVVAAQNMMVALERQDSSILSYLFTDDENTLFSFKENQVEFLKWSGTAEDNITEKGEKEVISAIHQNYIQFLNKVRILNNIQVSNMPEEAKDYYFEEVFPLFEEVKELCRNLQIINQNAMLDLKDKAHKTAQNAINSTVTIAILTMIIGGSLAWIFINRIIQPIHVLIDKVKKIAEGDYSQRIDVTGGGEISELACEFNIMAEKLSSFDQLNIERLMKEKKKSEAIVDSISEGIIVTDMNHKITLVNKYAEKIFEIDEKKSLDRHFLEVVKYENIFGLIQEAECIEKRKKINLPGEVIISLKQEGRTNHYRILALPIRHQVEEFIGTVTLIQDITKLKEIDDMKSEFVSTVSHEFRTPLTSISMGVGLLLEEVPGSLTDNQKELIEAMKEDQERLTSLVSDLLDLSRIESGKIQMDIVSNDTEKIIVKSVKTFEKQAKDNNIHLAYQLEENLPPVRADFNKVTWVMTNLIGNALRYTPTDGSGRILIEGKQTGNTVLVSVTDNGIGIPYEYRKKIFEKFVQVKDEQGHTTGGSGLGLAICKEIIQAHGGHIWVKSKIGEGSTFYFTLAVER
jgi:PAS domain S-box-containing protein